MTVNIPDSRNNPSMDPHPEIIEILPTSLLEGNRQLVSELKGMARSLGLDFGWHYLLDLVWMINKLGQVDVNVSWMRVPGQVLSNGTWRARAPR